MKFLKAKKLLEDQIGKTFVSTEGTFCVFTKEDFKGLSSADTFEVTERGLKVIDCLTKKGGYFPCDELPKSQRLPSRYPETL